MKFIRRGKLFAGLAVGLVLLIAGVGGQSVTVHAAEGDYCSMEGPATLSQGSTTLYVFRVEDNMLAAETFADLDDATGDSHITALLGADGSFEQISGTDFLNGLAVHNPSALDPSVLEEPQADYGWALDGDVCGKSTADVIQEGIESSAICDVNSDGDCDETNEWFSAAQ